MIAGSREKKREGMNRATRRESEKNRVKEK